MAVTREQMKAEAVERMKMLRMMPQTIKEFEKYGKLNLSEGYGALYWLDDEQNKIVRNWEEETGNLVYTAIHNWFDFGEVLTLLFVSQYKEEWKMDREDLKDGYPLCYAMNLSADFCSEYGSCCVRPSIGGLVRVS